MEVIKILVSCILSWQVFSFDILKVFERNHTLNIWKLQWGMSQYTKILIPWFIYWQSIPLIDYFACFASVSQSKSHMISHSKLQRENSLKLIQYTQYSVEFQFGSNKCNVFIDFCANFASAWHLKKGSPWND